MGKVSGVVIICNEEPNIGRCLESVRAVADEIIVMDSFSDDQTIHIAGKYGARVWAKIKKEKTALKLNSPILLTHKDSNLK